MLHQSLIELSEIAPQSTSTAALRGVLAEAQVLMRNAVDHREPGRELATWYSGIISSSLNCPAVTQGAAPRMLTGGIGRGDGLPSGVAVWITDNEDSELVQLFHSVGLKAEFFSSATPAQLYDTTPDVAGEQSASESDKADLLHLAISHRPPALQVTHGLPDRSARVDIRAALLEPVIDVGRWAAVTAGSSAKQTPARLAAGVAAGVIEAAQAQALEQAWETGVELQLRRWYDHVHDQQAIVDDLPALDRTAYGAAARVVSGVLRALATQHNIAF